jgi:hypothetical protein
MTTTPNMLRAALWYAQERQWHVFPLHNPIFHAGVCVGCSCESYRRSEQCRKNSPALYFGATGKCGNPGKCPRVAWGSKSTIDPNQIRKWWSYTWRDIDVETGEIVHNQPNLAIDCGKSNLLVFDADTYKQVGDLGDLLSFDDRETVTVITQGGGEHLMYNRQGKPYGNATKGLPAGIDIRGVGGYVVAVPSIGKSGRCYCYEEDYRPSQRALLTIPGALDAILSSATPKAKHRNPGIVLNAPMAVRNAVRLVETMLEKADLSASTAAYGDGMRWIFDECPFMPDDDQHANDAGAFVLVLDDGRIAAGCHHNRCQKRIEASGLNGWQFLRKLAGMERRQIMVTVTL